jgi:hypothetical protein
MEPEVSLATKTNGVLSNVLTTTCFAGFPDLNLPAEYVVYFPRVSCSITYARINMFLEILRNAFPNNLIIHPKDARDLFVNGVQMETELNARYVNVVFRTYRLLQEQPISVQSIRQIYNLFINTSLSKKDAARIAIFTGAINGPIEERYDYSKIKLIKTLVTGMRTDGHWWSDADLSLRKVLSFLIFDDQLTQEKGLFAKTVAAGDYSIDNFMFSNTNVNEKYVNIGSPSVTDLDVFVSKMEKIVLEFRGEYNGNKAQ